MAWSFMRPARCARTRTSLGGSRIGRDPKLWREVHEQRESASRKREDNEPPRRPGSQHVRPSAPRTRCPIPRRPGHEGIGWAERVAHPSAARPACPHVSRSPLKRGRPDLSTTCRTTRRGLNRQHREDFEPLQKLSAECHRQEGVLSSRRRKRRLCGASRSPARHSTPGQIEGVDGDAPH